jgi:tetratricopeptide (TPR) repeat protein
LSRDLSLADAALRAQHTEQALEGYDKIVASHASCSAVVWNYAVASAYAHTPAALSNLSAALPYAPSLSVGQIVVGLAQLSAGDVPGARSTLQSGLDAPLTTQAAAGAAAGISKLSSAAEKALASPAGRDTLWARAILAQASGEIAKARTDLERLSRMEADCPAVWFALGGVALEEARAASRRLSETAPDSEWNRRLEAEALAVRYPALAQNLWPGNRQGASEAEHRWAPPGSDLKEAESPESLYEQARVALRVSQDAYRRASQSPQFSAYLHALKGLAAEQENDEAAAIREYQEGLTQNPNSTILHAGLGHLYRQRLDLKAAQTHLERARELDSADPLIAFELGDVYLRLGQTQQALPLLNQALELDPELLLARWSRGKAFLALGDNERALADLEAATPVDNTGDLQFQLARLYQKVGRPDLAAKARKRSEEQRTAVDGRQ